MKVIDRYIGQHVIKMVALVLLALLGLDIFFYFVNELRFIGEGDYGLWRALEFIVLTIPRKLYTLLPWSILIGNLLALGHLSKNSELIAMRAASISMQRIAWAALKASSVLIIAAFVLGEWVAPYSEEWAQQRKVQAISGGQAIQTQFGTWVRHGYEFLHIGSAHVGNHLQDITRYYFDEQLSLQMIEQTKDAQQNQNQWTLTDNRVTEFFSEGVEVRDEPERQVQELVDVHILKTSDMKYLERLSLTQLWSAIQSRLANDLNAKPYQRAFWVKIVQPFAMVVMVYLAVPFASGPLRSTSVGFKLLIGILLGFSFHTLNAVFAPLTMVLDMPPFLAAVVPTLFFTLLACVMIRKTR